MIPPDGHTGDVFVAHARFPSQSIPRTIVVQARHRRPAFRRDIATVVVRDQAVGIAGIANNQNANIRRGIGCQGLPLGNKDLGIFAEEILAFHSLQSWEGPHQERPVAVLERAVGIVRDNHLVQGWEATIA